jgi:hypothetical protein
MIAEILTDEVEQMRAELRIASRMVGDSLRLTPLERALAASALCADLVGELDRESMEQLRAIAIGLSQQAGQS